MSAPASLKTNVPPLKVTSSVADKVVKAPVLAEAAPTVVPSIAPAAMSTLDISTSPVPLGVIAMLPLAPSAIVITPELVPLLVEIVMSPVP